MFFAATTGVELSDCTQTVSEHFIEPDLQIHRIDGGTRAALILGTLELFLCQQREIEIHQNRVLERDENPIKRRGARKTFPGEICTSGEESLPFSPRRAVKFSQFSV